MEWKLKEIGMNVGILYPKESVPLIDILEDLSTRGCPFGVVITPQNEQHKSVTVNILFGWPQGKTGC